MLFLIGLSFISATFAHPPVCRVQPFDQQCIGSPDPYIVAPSPGKGLGVFAVHKLETGSIIMREAPIIKIKPPHHNPGKGYPTAIISELVNTEYNLLSRDQQIEVRSLTYYISPAEEEYTDKSSLLGLIFRNNAYDTGSEIGLFPKIARINHSCRPNAAYYWSEKLQKRIIYATRVIQEGEEVFVSFISLLASREERQKRLARYGFVCTCPACSQHPVDLHQSDESRASISRAFQAFSTQLTLNIPKSKVGIRKARKNAESSLQLVDLVQKESLADYYATAYRIAAISHARIADWEKATVWANEAYKRRVMEDAGSAWTMEMFEMTSMFIEKWQGQLKNKTKPE